MKLTRNILDRYSSQYDEFNYYYTILDKIESNEVSNPDICIESCKSLIEGISKTILSKLNRTLSQKEIDAFDLQVLYKKAVTQLGESLVVDNNFEIDFCNRFGSTIHLLGELRNARGDISHGRSVPKQIFSCVKFSKTIKGFTDNIACYILEHLFDALSYNSSEELDYNNKELAGFNAFLDIQETMPIAHVSYSKALYDYDYTMYKTKYIDYIAEQDTPTQELQKEIYDNFNYWTSDRLDVFSLFCKTRGLNQPTMFDLIDRYLSSGRTITREDILDVMFVKLLDDTQQNKIADEFVAEIPLMIQQIRDKK